MATRIFLAMGSLLIREIRRSGVWHFSQTVSTPKTRRSKSDHLMYLRLLLGLSWPASGHRTTASVAGVAPCAGGILPYDFTVKVTVCVFTFVPAVAVNVIVAVPAAAAALAANFTVVLPFPGAAKEAGVNAAVTPAGNP